jgi:hypothetical protein
MRLKSRSSVEGSERYSCLRCPDETGGKINYMDFFLQKDSNYQIT